MSERAKFEKWLTDLDARRSSTPAHVFDRVRGDYTTRLEGVLEKLKTHSEAMREHAASLSAKLEQLAESEQAILDSRAESELRAQVGELSPGDWEKTSKKLEKDLAKIKQDQELISEDLRQLRELMGTFDSAPATASGEGQDDAPATAGAGGGAPKAPGNVDELAFLKSVIGATPSEPQAAAREAAPPARAARAARAAETSDEEVVERKAETEAPKPAPKPAAPKLVDSPAASPVIRARQGEEPLSMHVTGANPIVLRTSGVMEQPKTLKCAECGAMNYPSEWYCERCGAELTNV